MLKSPLACRNRALLLLSVCLLVVPFGCRASDGASPAVRGPLITPAMSDTAGRAMVRTELLFGLSRGDDRSPVSEAEWQGFVDDSIGVWFPSGFTIIDAMGRWRDSDGKITAERSRVLLIFHDGSEQTLRKLDDLRRLYGQRFGQQSVIRASSNAWVAF